MELVCQAVANKQTKEWEHEELRVPCFNRAQPRQRWELSWEYHVNRATSASVEIRRRVGGRSYRTGSGKGCGSTTRMAWKIRRSGPNASREAGQTAGASCAVEALNCINEKRTTMIVVRFDCRPFSSDQAVVSCCVSRRRRRAAPTPAAQAPMPSKASEEGSGTAETDDIVTSRLAIQILSDPV